MKTKAIIQYFKRHGFDVEISHIRKRHCPFGDVEQTGGVTTIYATKTIDEDPVGGYVFSHVQYAGAAWCSDKDQYHKKIGAHLAANRLLNAYQEANGGNL